MGDDGGRAVAAARSGDGRGARALRRRNHGCHRGGPEIWHDLPQHQRRRVHLRPGDARLHPVEPRSEPAGQQPGRRRRRHPVGGNVARPAPGGGVQRPPPRGDETDLRQRHRQHRVRASGHGARRAAVRLAQQRSRRRQRHECGRQRADDGRHRNPAAGGRRNGRQPRRRVAHHVERSGADQPVDRGRRACDRLRAHGRRHQPAQRGRGAAAAALPVDHVRRAHADRRPGIRRQRAQPGELHAVRGHRRRTGAAIRGLRRRQPNGAAGLRAAAGRHLHGDRRHRGAERHRAQPAGGVCHDIPGSGRPYQPRLYRGHQHALRPRQRDNLL